MRFRLHAATSAKAKLPPGTILGHELAGVVEQIGAGVTGFERGDRVVVMSYWLAANAPVVAPASASNATR